MKRLFLSAFLITLICGIVVAQQVGRQGAQNQNTQQPLPSAVIEGTVTHARTGQLLKGARITLLRANTQAPAAAARAGIEQNALLSSLITNLAGSVASVTTDALGHFTFEGVSQGQYRLSAEREGFIRTEYGQRTFSGSGIPVAVANAQHLKLELQMTPASVLSGRVLNEDGEPASQATVQAYTYQYADGERTLAQVANAETNDLGEYRLFWLQPGEYFVGVKTQDPPGEEAVGRVDVSQNRRGSAQGAQGVQLLTAVLGTRGGLLAEALVPSTAPVYYPGTIDPDAAVAIAVAPSVEVRGLDLSLRRVRTATVSGRVIAPFSLATTPPANGQRAANQELLAALGNFAAALGQNAQVSLTRIGAARRGLGLAGLADGISPVSADGTFEIRDVAPGAYSLTALARDPNGQQYAARMRVDVGSSDIGNLAITVKPGVEIRGKIALTSTPPQQFRMTQLRVALVAEDSPVGALPININVGQQGRGGRGGGRGGGNNVAANLLGGQANAVTVAEDGSFTLPNIMPVEYRVRVTGLPAGAYIETGRFGSVDAMNAPFTVDSQAQLQLQIGFTTSKVSGVVVDAARNAAPGARVVLVPDEARRGRSDLYYSATTDANGQFNFNNVVPGNYKAFAWEDVPAGAYQYPDFIRRFETRGQPVTVDRNGTATVEARLIPAGSQ